VIGLCCLLKVFRVGNIFEFVQVQRCHFLGYPSDNKEVPKIFFGEEIHLAIISFRHASYLVS
jgi:hypothetical protein